MRRWFLATLVVLVGCGGGDPGDGGSTDDPDASSGTASPGPLTLGAPFPSLSLESSDGSAPALTGGWSVVGLNPARCRHCEDEYSTLLGYSPVWNEFGLQTVTIIEGDAAAARALAEAEQFEHPVMASRTPLFPVTRELDRSTYVVVDPEGNVRFRARQRGTFDERMVSVRRNHRLLSEPGIRDTLARAAFPAAASVEVVSTLDTPWLGAETLQLGLSAWIVIARDESGKASGVGFPIERDTNCTTCEPIYLLVALGEARRIASIVEIEPVISLGRVQDLRTFIQRCRQKRTVAQIEQLPRSIASERADQVARELITTALTLGKRIPEELLPTRP